MAAPLENLNAEVWSFDKANELFNLALEKSIEKEYDFIGEIARDLNTYREIFVYLVDKFPQLKTTHKRILANLEANCFSHTKRGEINVAIGIVNLKSNYNWTDRNDITTQGESVNIISLGTGINPEEDETS